MPTVTWMSIGRMNAGWSAAGAGATVERCDVGGAGRAGNVRAHTDDAGSARPRASRWPATAVRSEGGVGEERLRGVVGVEVGEWVATAEPEEGLGRGARGGDLGWLRREVEVGEDGGDDGRVGDRGEDSDGPGAARAHQQVVAEDAAGELGPGEASGPPVGRRRAGRVVGMRHWAPAAYLDASLHWSETKAASYSTPGTEGRSVVDAALFRYMGLARDEVARAAAAAGPR